MTIAVTSDIRELAAESFAKLGWPTTRLEEWRYTNLAPVQKIAWRADDAPQHVESAAAYGDRAAIELVFVNGRLTGGADPAHWPAGVRLLANTGTIADIERNAVAAMNVANGGDGARISIDAGTIVDGFIHLLFIGNGDGIWAHPRNQISVGSNAQVAIVESYVGSGSYLTNALTEITAAEGAVLEHYKVECESPTAYHLGNIFIRQERSSSVTSRSISIGGALARTETHVALAGEGASVVLDGLFVGTGTQHLDNLTSVDHITPHCESVQLYKGILDQSARGVFDGRIIVRPGAIKTASRQTNRNLLLSETAIVDSKPNLEIHNDDVKCSHGSTIGQLDAEQLFYLRSRGVGEDDARSLLVHAFASEIVDRMKIEPVREQIRRALFQTMPDRMPERRAGDRGQRSEESNS